MFIFSREHNALYVSAYKIFLDNKILGEGVKNYRNICGKKEYFIDKYSCATHPHNTYIQILSETGIFGFIFLIIVLFYFCYYILLHLKLRLKSESYFSDFEICLLSAIAIYLWPFIPTGNVFSNWLNIAMILNLPFLLWKKSKLTL